MPGNPTVPIGGINCTILADSGLVEGIDGQRGPHATVKFKCPWANRYTVANAIAGTSTISGGSIGTIFRVIPMQYGRSPNLYAASVDIVGLGGPACGSDGYLDYDYAVLTTRFQAFRFDFVGVAGSSPFMSITYTMGGEFLTLPDTTYRFGDGTPTNTPVGRIIPSIEVEFRRHWLPYLPVSAVAALSGKLNNAPITIGDYTAAIGECLFLGATTSITFDGSGNRTQEAGYRFSIRPGLDWRLVFHPDRTTGWDYVTDGSGGYIYELGDFSTLP